MPPLINQRLNALGVLMILRRHRRVCERNDLVVRDSRRFRAGRILGRSSKIAWLRERRLCSVRLIGQLSSFRSTLCLS
jgi:hypothetical protein